MGIRRRGVASEDVARARDGNRDAPGSRRLENLEVGGARFRPGVCRVARSTPTKTSTCGAPVRVAVPTRRSARWHGPVGPATKLRTESCSEERDQTSASLRLVRSDLCFSGHRRAPGDLVPPPDLPRSSRDPRSHEGPRRNRPPKRSAGKDLPEGGPQPSTSDAIASRGETDVESPPEGGSKG